MDDSAVKIAVRERPPRVFTLQDEPSVVSYHERCSNILVVDERPFTFDYVLGPTATQQQIFEELIKPMVGKVTQGYNCTVLAYGQTGTGKSYTMGLNSVSFDGDQVGVIPRCLRELQSINKNTEDVVDNEFGTKTMEIFGSFIEIYNEKVFDLLSQNSKEPIIARSYKYSGGTRKALKTLEDCYNLLVQGNKNRHVRPTSMNSQSSRSHAIFTIHVHKSTSQGTTRANLNLVDLAGSEGVRRTGHQGVAMSEGVHINQGLLSINKVLQAKAMGSKVIPYRDSVLSSVLQDSLNANSYLTLLACISPHRADLSETLSTLRFAQRSKQLKHTPLVGSILADLKKNIGKTPRKFNYTPMKRTATQAGLMAPYHSNTFCTPSKIKCVNTGYKLNHSEIGLTPKEKKKIKINITTANIMEPTTNAAINPLNANEAPGGNRESLFDQTLDSRASLMSLNMSSSTAVDVNFGNKVISFSPIVRRCMSQIENVVENKMAQLVETFKEINKENFNRPRTTHASPWNNSTAPLTQTLRQELKSIMKEVFTDGCAAQLEANKMLNANDTVSLLLNADTSPLHEGLKKCQLFTTSSPVYKEAELPAQDSAHSSRIPHAMHFDVTISECNNTFNETDQPVQNKTALRRSRRISLSQKVKAEDKLNESSATSKNLRRSRRLSALVQQCEHANEVSVLSNTSIKETEKMEQFRPRRRSGRKSIIQICNERRYSVRLATHKEELEAEAAHVPKSNKNKLRTAAMNNSILAGYLSDKPNLAPKTNKKANFTKHRQAILQLLNTGSMKELQLLPQIGQKTAFQLVTQRTLKGRFKNLTQIEKLPIWRGSSWQRFAQANMLTD